MLSDDADAESGNEIQRAAKKERQPHEDNWAHEGHECSAHSVGMGITDESVTCLDENQERSLYALVRPHEACDPCKSFKEAMKQGAGPGGRQPEDSFWCC